jgi:cytochrome c peroxidase
MIRSARKAVLVSLVIVLPLMLWQTGAAAWLQEAVASRTTPSFRVPAGWPTPHYDFAANPITPAGFALGRKLFYEPRLSKDDSVSCGSCHQQFAAFAHFDHPVSHGIRNQNGTRNAPGLFNLAWQPALMWDGAVHNLEIQPIAPISNPVEMDASLDQVLTKLRASADYPPLFEAAFGTPEIDSQRLLRAMTQFTGTLISADSRYDRFMAGDAAALSESERAGLAVFRAECASCHAEPLFTDYSYRNNGLDEASKDPGRARATGRDEDRGRFRVPSLRNVALTAPYMHDGRYDTLDQVLDHYTQGIHASPALDPKLAGGVKLDTTQRADLLAFLRTLSDEHFTHDRRFAEARN